MVSNLGIAKKAAKTPLTAVAIKAGVVNIEAGPVATPAAVAPAIDCDIDEASIIAINFVIVPFAYRQIIVHSVVFIIMYVAGFYLQSTYAVQGFEIAKIAR